MPFRIVLVDEAADDLRRLSVYCRTAIKGAIEQHLRHQPALLSKSRVKRLEEIESPQYRLRVGEYRVFYDLSGNDVVVLSILSKKESVSWLRERGKPKE